MGKAKAAVRQRIWDLLEQERVVPEGVHGHIPTFDGAELAADQLTQLTVWSNTHVVVAVPDRAQLPVRARALEQDKLIYMAVPKLASLQPFYHLNPVRGPEAAAAGDPVWAAGRAPTISIDEMEPVDIVVCGSLAVNPEGARIGKGAGYSDIEVALLHEAGMIGPATTIVTTVHPLQIVNEDLPESPHDFRVNLIVTPDGIIESGSTAPPTGLLWDSLDPATIANIPVLRSLQHRKNVDTDPSAAPATRDRRAPPAPHVSHPRKK